MTTALLDPNTFFENARRYSSHSDRSKEIEWQRNLEAHLFSESDLLRETAWVILCSGFREKIVRKAFDYISLCYFDWESSHEIDRHRHICITAALSSFKNKRKLIAIAESASIVAASDFGLLKRSILNDPFTALQQFPYIGPITAWHLAKNLGIEVAKPDRHLVRLANACGHTSVTDLCSDLADRYDEQIKVVDLILWRYLADHPKILSSL